LDGQFENDGDLKYLWRSKCYCWNNDFCS